MKCTTKRKGKTTSSFFVFCEQRRHFGEEKRKTISFEMQMNFAAKAIALT